MKTNNNWCESCIARIVVLTLTAGFQILGHCPKSVVWYKVWAADSLEETSLGKKNSTLHYGFIHTLAEFGINRLKAQASQLLR